MNLALPAPRLGARSTFVIFLAGQLVSWLGTRINAIALPLLTIERYGVGLSLGLVAATRLVPRIVLGPAAGALADRLPRRPVLIAANLLSGLLVALVPLTGALWQLYLLTALVGLVEALLRPASFALLPELFDREQIYRVNAAQEVLDAVANLLGPTIAVALIAAGGMGAAFVADACTFVVAAACLVPVRPLRVADRPEAGEGRGEEAGFGAVLRLLRTDRTLALLLWANSGYTLGIGVLIILYAPLALGLGAGDWGFGALVTATGAGALLGTLLAPRLGPLLTPRRILLSLVVSGLLVAAVAPLRTLPAILPLLLLAHAPESLCYLAFASESQRRVPPHLLGRYYGVAMTILASAIPVGNFLGGVVASSVDPRLGVAGVGVIFVLTALLGLPLSRQRAPAR
jgi:MFS family permease